MADKSQEDMKDLFNITMTEDREDGIKYGPTSLHRRRIFKKYLKDIPFQSLLEIGCGNGNFLKHLILNLEVDHENLSVSGFDIAQKAVEEAKKKLKGNFYIMDISKEKPDESFDLVICSELLEHVEDYKSALRNIADICDHYLLLSTPCGPYGDHPGSMIRYYPKAQIMKELTDVGFKIVKCQRWGFPFFTPIHEMIIHSLGIAKNPLRTGKFGLTKKILAKIVYYLFFLNIYDMGDRVYVLAKK